MSLDYNVELPVGYLVDRARTIVEFVLRFLLTWTLLLILPRDFLLMLDRDGASVYELRILKSRNETNPFKFWRQPMKPAGYLFTATLLGTVLGQFFGVYGELNSLFCGVTRKLHVFLASWVPTIFPGFIIELTLVILLFMLMTPYQRALDIRPRWMKTFVE